MSKILPFIITPKLKIILAILENFVKKFQNFQKNTPTTSRGVGGKFVNRRFLRSRRNRFLGSRNHSGFRRCKDPCSRASGDEKIPARSRPGSVPDKGSRCRLGHSRSGETWRSCPVYRQRPGSCNRNLPGNRIGSGWEENSSSCNNSRLWKNSWECRKSGRSSPPHPGSAPKLYTGKLRNRFSHNGGWDRSSNRRRP